MGKRLSIRQRFRHIRNYTGTEFFGWYRGYQVEVNREPDNAFYIQVSGGDGYLYDGWWRPEFWRHIDDAIYEALFGSQLLRASPASGPTQTKDGEESR